MNTPPLVDYAALHAIFDRNCTCGPEEGPCAGHTALMDTEIVLKLRKARASADRLNREEWNADYVRVEEGQLDLEAIFAKFDELREFARARREGWLPSC